MLRVGQHHRGGKVLVYNQPLIGLWSRMPRGQNRSGVDKEAGEVSGSREGRSWVPRTDQATPCLSSLTALAARSHPQARGVSAVMQPTPGPGGTREEALTWAQGGLSSVKVRPVGNVPTCRAFLCVSLSQTDAV